jgi:hypothetical protein
MLDCYYHPEVEAVAGCVRCHKLICSHCRILKDDKTYCPHCYLIVSKQKQPITTPRTGNTSDSENIKALLKKMVEKLGN